MGWIGSKDELMNVLSTFKVDRGPGNEGAFHVGGNISSFMGAGDEYVVGPDAVAYIEGKPVNLCGLLGATSYGLKVVVI